MKKAKGAWESLLGKYRHSTGIVITRAQTEWAIETATFRLSLSALPSIWILASATSDVGVLPDIGVPDVGNSPISEKLYPISVSPISGRLHARLRLPDSESEEWCRYRRSKPDIGH